MMPELLYSIIVTAPNNGFISFWFQIYDRISSYFSSHFPFPPVRFFPSFSVPLSLNSFFCFLLFVNALGTLHFIRVN